ncbi:MAG: hypothetical protein ACLFTQ_01725 [Candidatus Aenigmatarchaeota archaeon]
MSWRDVIQEKSDEVPFLVFVSFLISFLAARIYVYFLGNVGTAADIFPFEKYILHHLYYGVGLLIIAGWISIIYKDKNLNRISAVIYGAGLGIFFDEVGLLLTEFADYWAGITYTVVVVISLLLLNIVFFSDFWEEVRSGVTAFAERHRLDRGPWNLMGMVDILEEVEDKMSQTRKITTVFVGIILIVTGILVIRYPSLIKYWVGGAFVLSGIAHLIEVAKK